MTCIKTLLTIILLMKCVLPSQADDSTRTKIEPELQADQELLDKIAKLPINTWLKLPPIKVAGDLEWVKEMNWNSMRERGPYGRDFSNKAAWMPDRKRAIYAGGGHNNIPLNDVWEYDLASNTWVCLYGADKPAQGQKPEWVKENLMIEDGVLKTKRSGPPRLSHTFDGWDYDASRRVAIMPESLRGAVFVDPKVVAQGLGLSEEELLKQWRPAPYFLTFDPYSRKWGYITDNVPKCGRDPSAKYIGHLNSYWVNSGGSMGLFDPSSKTTKKLNLNGGGGGYNSSTAYDPETKSIVVISALNKDGNAKTWVYSIETDSWKLMQPNAPIGGCSQNCYFDYDSKAKQFVLYTTSPKNSVWVYDVKENKWSEIETTGDQPVGGAMIGYYDPERDVLVHYNSKNVWVCRLKKTETK